MYPSTAGRPRRRLTLAAVAAGAVLPATLLTGLRPTGAAADGSGIQRLAETIPNYMRSSYGLDTSSPQGTSAAAFADPVNGFLFETDVGGVSKCQSPMVPLVELDLDTYRRRADGCGGTRPGFDGGGATKSPLVAVDPVDRLLFFTDGVADGNFFPSNVGGPKDSILAMSEDTLKVVATWHLPSNANQTVYGLSWYAPRDQLIVETAEPGDAQLPQGPPGVQLTAYSIADSLTRKAPALWSTSLQGTVCSYPLATNFATANAYRSEHLSAIFLGCQVGSKSGVSETKRVVLSVPLTTTGCPSGADACPDTTRIASTPVPGLSDDFMYDPGSDRGYLPTQDNSGTTLLVYDGTRQAFAGRIAVATPRSGQVNPYENNADFGLDTMTGRVYAAGGGGFFFSDGRRTPLAPGTTVGDLRGDVNYETMPVLPPTQRHPFTRIIVNYCKPGTGGNTGSNCDLDHFSVVADDITVTQDPPAAQIDGNTYSGPVPKGADVATTYSGNARAYGVHSDLVGGIAGAYNNATQGAQAVPNGYGDGNKLPFGTGNRDLIAGLVGHLTLSGGDALGDAQSLTDPASVTAAAYERCSNLQVVLSCLDPRQPPMPSAPDTTQTWPFPLAQCNHQATDPPDGQGARQSVSGMTMVLPPPAGDGTPSPVPDSQAMASASVDCARSGGAVGGTSALQGMQLGPATDGAPGAAVPATVSVAEATATTSVQPPAKDGGVGSAAHAAARGIRIDLGGGDELRIGEVSQDATSTAAGVPGSARTARTVLVANVEVSVGGSTTVLCTGTCTQTVDQLVAQLNAVLPSTIQLVAPQPQPLYAKGSPGGYIAAVQADIPEQYGDQQFNGMSAGEAVFLPALRVIVYNDASPVGAYQLSREILDFAGVDIDTEQGITVLPAAEPLGELLSIPAVVAGAQTVSGFQPERPLPPPPPPAPPVGSTQYAPVAAPSGIVARTLAGLHWLVRSPGDALRMFAFLCVLGLPFVLMWRRGIAISGGS